jgi:hypothetical protein
MDDIPESMDTDKTIGSKFQTTYTKHATHGGAKTVGDHVQEIEQIAHLYSEGMICLPGETAINLGQVEVFSEQCMSGDKMENIKETELGEAYQVHKDSINSSVSLTGGCVKKAEKVEKLLEAELEGHTEKDHTPEVIAHWYAGGMIKEAIDERDIEQKSRWEEFKRTCSSQIEVGVSLLQSMELLEDGSEASDREAEDQMKLDVDVVEKITKARSLKVQLAEKKKGRTAPWGPNSS